MQDHYDVVIVGSGPISMMEAAHQARNGSTVLLLEEKPYLGGAWYTKSHWGFGKYWYIYRLAKNSADPRTRRVGEGS